MYKEKFRQKTGLPLLNAVAADDCTDGIDVADTVNELVFSDKLVIVYGLYALQRFTDT